METFFKRLEELKGTQSTAAFARSIGIPQPSMDRYLKGRVPTLEVLKLLCSVYSVSADWLLGLPERGGSVPRAEGVSPTQPKAVRAGDGATVSPGSGNATAVSSGGDCSRCQLMAAHIREITGRG